MWGFEISKFNDKSDFLTKIQQAKLTPQPLIGKSECKTALVVLPAKLFKNLSVLFEAVPWNKTKGGGLSFSSHFNLKSPLSHFYMPNLNTKTEFE